MLCLNTRRFGLRQHRLYGQWPLHCTGLNFAIQLYAHKEVCRHALTAMIRVGNCIRFSTSRFRSNLFLLRTYSQRKEDMKRKRKQKLLISKPYKVHHALQDYSITFCKKSCPHICKSQSILLSFSTYLLTRSRSSRHSASLDISLISVVSSSRCSSRAASIFLLQSSDFPER